MAHVLSTRLFDWRFCRLNNLENISYVALCIYLFEMLGRTGRANRKGEAITFYTEEDFPYLRNIANVITSSGGEVPSWIMSRSKLKWKKHTPKRESITTAGSTD